MKTIDAKIPGLVDIFVEGDCKKHIIRRDFVDDYDHLQLGVSKRENDRHYVIKPVLEAGLLFFKTLGINGYTLECYFNKGIPKGYNLESDDYLKVFTIFALNDIMNINLSHDELVDICNKMSINMDTYLTINPVRFDQDKNIIDKESKTDDNHYLLMKLPDRFTTGELVKYFMKDQSLYLGFDDCLKYEELINIKLILNKYNAKVVSTNGYSNILVATFTDVHERFKAGQELAKYEQHKFARGKGLSYIKCYK